MPPRGKKAKELPQQAAPSKQTESEDGLEYDDNLPDSQPSSVDEEEEEFSKIPAKKRPAEGEPEDLTGEMQKMLESFGSDITKTMKNKRRRLETYTQSSLKNSNKKVDDIWRGQAKERTKLHEEFSKQISGVFNQWDADLGKFKEQEDKLMNLFQQQQKLFSQTRIAQTQRLKTIKQLHEQYIKGMMNLEKAHGDQQGNVQGEIKKEMALLQKKILMDTQQQEMANVRKSLQTMLF